MTANDRQRPLSVCAAAALAVLVGCGSPRPKGEAFPLLPAHVDYPESFHEQVELKAFFPRDGQDFRDGERRLDFAKRQNLIPIGLRMGVQSRSSGGGIDLDEDTARIRLYLPDGTVLAPKPTRAIEGEAKDREVQAIGELSLKFGMLAEYEAAAPLTYVFFEGPPGFTWGKGSSIVYASGGLVHEVDLTQSMLSLTIGADAMSAETLNVGVRRER